jgi:hypothetical protein
MQNQTKPRSTKPHILLGAFIVTILLVALSDVLLFDAEPGINLFLSVVAIALGILVIACRRERYRQGAAGLMTATVLSLPLVEAPSLLACGFAALGLSLSALIAVRLLPDELERVPVTVLRFLVPTPATLIRDAAALRPAIHDQVGRKAAVWLMAWVVPLSLGAVFAFLFASANPVIEGLLSKLRLETVLDLLDPIRMLFWLVLAMAIWSLLRPKVLGRRPRRESVHLLPETNSIWLGQAAVFRSLVVFNGLFALQTGLDLTYLWGGMALPDGMSHAEYAHRGAYPLIATALLAGAFVLAAMRENGPGHHHKVIRALVYLFLAQNVLLCLSAMLRLNLYVEVYSMTDLRLAAGIWMGLVATGLVLVTLRILLRKRNSWLIATNLVALMMVLYASAMLDLSGYIARFNVEHSWELTKTNLPTDLSYLQTLGPSAIPALDRLIPRLIPGGSRWAEAVTIRAALVRGVVDEPGDWRSWFWRMQRLQDYLVMHELASAPPNRQNGSAFVR